MENALVGFASTELARRDTAAARDDSLEALVLAMGSYDAGTVDLQEVVQIELQVLESEYSLLGYEGQLAQSAVMLYKAAGGDWTPVLPGPDGPIPMPSDLDSVASTSSGESS
jgi:outer membrane protein TolC